MRDRCTAIVLAGGQGRRMGGNIQKQYMEVMDKPLLAYSLETFQQSEAIDDIILVVGAGQEDFCREKIVEAYGIEKVSAIVQGGSERYESVWNGLKLLKPEGYAFIHDGARPFVTEEIIQRAYRDVQQYHACVVGMPVKDTIKVVDADGMSEHTPDRSTLWLIQTPQVFETRLIQDAYAKLMSLNCIQVTDDAMVAEQMLGTRIKMTEGSYENIKITTPEDMEIAEVFARKNL
jgi:2-C-methyl-D-erythritol 4-phosphate cytidylyltransferase